MEFQTLDGETFLEATARFFALQGYNVEINSKTITINTRRILPISNLIRIDDLYFRSKGEGVSQIQLLIFSGDNGIISFGGFSLGYCSLQSISRLFKILGNPS
jgi:hypothetical protein